MSDIGDIVGPGLGQDGDLSEANGERRICSVDVTEGSPLRITNNGEWALCSVDTYENAAAVAVATETVSAGDDALGIYIGKVSLPLSPFTNSEPIFLKSDGTITNVATTIIGEYITRLGKGLYAGVIYVQCSEPVKVIS